MKPLSPEQLETVVKIAWEKFRVAQPTNHPAWDALADGERRNCISNAAVIIRAGNKWNHKHLPWPAAVLEASREIQQSKGR